MNTNNIDTYYPLDDALESAAKGQTLGLIGLVTLIRQHLCAARSGDRESESRLINRVGQIRRAVPKLTDCDPGVLLAVRSAVDWLRTVNRQVNLGGDNAAMWITRRGGMPRW